MSCSGGAGVRQPVGAAVADRADDEAARGEHAGDEGRGRRVAAAPPRDPARDVGGGLVRGEPGGLDRGGEQRGAVGVRRGAGRRRVRPGEHVAGGARGGEAGLVGVGRGRDAVADDQGRERAGRGLGGDGDRVLVAGVPRRRCRRPRRPRARAGRSSGRGAGSPACRTARSSRRRAIWPPHAAQTTGRAARSTGATATPGRTVTTGWVAGCTRSGAGAPAGSAPARSAPQFSQNRSPSTTGDAAGRTGHEDHAGRSPQGPRGGPCSPDRPAGPARRGRGSAPRGRGRPARRRHGGGFGAPAPRR